MLPQTPPPSYQPMSPMPEKKRFVSWKGIPRSLVVVMGVVIIAVGLAFVNYQANKIIPGQKLAKMNCVEKTFSAGDTDPVPAASKWLKSISARVSQPNQAEFKSEIAAQFAKKDFTSGTAGFRGSMGYIEWSYTDTNDLAVKVGCVAPGIYPAPPITSQVTSGMGECTTKTFTAGPATPPKTPADYNLCSEGKLNSSPQGTAYLWLANFVVSGEVSQGDVTTFAKTAGKQAFTQDFGAPRSAGNINWSFTQNPGNAKTQTSCSLALTVKVNCAESELAPKKTSILDSVHSALKSALLSTYKAALALALPRTAYAAGSCQGTLLFNKRGEGNQCPGGCPINSTPGVACSYGFYGLWVETCSNACLGPYGYSVSPDVMLQYCGGIDSNGNEVLGEVSVSAHSIPVNAYVGSETECFDIAYAIVGEEDMYEYSYNAEGGWLAYYEDPSSGSLCNPYGTYGVKDGAEECDVMDFGDGSPYGYGACVNGESRDCTTSCTVQYYVCGGGGSTGGGPGGGGTSSGGGSLCGNGIVNAGEQCDGGSLGGASCTTQGFTGGSLSCSSSCTFNTSSCTNGGAPAPAITADPVAPLQLPNTTFTMTYSVTGSNAGSQCALVDYQGVNLTSYGPCTGSVSYDTPAVPSSYLYYIRMLGGGLPDTLSNPVYITALPLIPTGVQTSCNAAGTQATISWDPMPYVDAYSARFSPLDNGSCPAGWQFSGFGSTCIPNPDRVVGTSITFDTVPGTTYGTWVHSLTDFVGWSDAAGSGVTCTALTTCAIPWGGTAAIGAHITGYQDSAVVAPATCVSEDRVCQADGTFSGSFNNQSCSQSAQPLADLVTGTPSSTAFNPGAGVWPTPGTPATFTDTVTNIDTAAAGSFPNKIQFTKDYVTYSNVSAGTVSSLAGNGAIANISGAVNFTSTGEWYVRACADVNASGGGQSVIESDEGNNCGSWLTVRVVTSAPTGVQASCNAAGTQATISWNAASGASSYYVRVAPSLGSCPSGWQVASWDSNTCIPNPDYVPATSINFTTTPGQAYSTLVHGSLSTGEWGNPGTDSFTCSAPTTCTLPWGGTIAVGNSVDAYDQSAVTAPATCDSVKEVRTCQASGTLSGTFNNRTCSVSAALTADLTISVDASASPSSPVAGTAATLSATIKNEGAATAGGTFPNMIQIDNDVDHITSISEVVSTNSVSALAVNATAAISVSHTFSSAGTYYLRACTDVNASYGGQSVTESDEGNNCGNWITITVSAPVAGTCGGTTVSNCDLSTVSVGSSSGSCASGYTGSCSYSCSAGGWSQGSNSCTSSGPSGPSGPSVSCSLNATPSSVNSGDAVTLSWDCGGTATSCTGTGFSTGSGSPSTGSTIINPTVSNNYGMVCDGTNITPVRVTVGSPVSITATPSRVPPGGNTTIAWRASGAASCTVQKNGSGASLGSGSSGSFNVSNLTVQTTYVATCDTGTAKVVVNIGPNFQEF